MPTIPLHPPSPLRSPPQPSSLPSLLRTPSGLALLEIQGTINIPSPPASSSSQTSSTTTTTTTTTTTPIGRLLFPDYDPKAPATDLAWMKRVYLYVGKYQRLTGEVKRLGRPVGVMKRRGVGGRGEGTGEGMGEGEEGKSGRGEEVEIVEVVVWRVVFSGRPEPVGGEVG